MKALARKTNIFTEKKGETKNLLPLIEEIVLIVKKSRVAVNDEKKTNKAIFTDGALERATKISNKIGTLKQTVGNESFGGAE